MGKNWAGKLPALHKPRQFFPASRMPSLPQILREQLLAAGPLPFAQVMQQALYHPEHGYYGAGPRRIGRQGDFFTSVSVGPLFGRLLALQAVQEWQALGEP